MRVRLVRKSSTHFYSEKCEDFIANFEDEALEQAGLLHGKFKYMNMLVRDCF
jgi:hypothetical protein